MGITQRDESDIEFFFRHQGDTQRSTSGAMLARAQRMTTDSAGRKVAAYQDDWHWRPNGAQQTIPVHEARDSVGYEPDDAHYIRFSRVSRIMRQVRARDMLAFGVLEAYYGDRGARWRETAVDRFDAKGKLERRGYGPGAIASVYVCTDRGAKLLEVEQKRLGKAVPGHRRHDEVLDLVLASPGKVAGKLSKVRDEAEELLAEARSLYMACAARHDGGARRTREPPGYVRAWRDGSFLEVA